MRGETTLKSGSLHFADEGPIIIIIIPTSWVGSSASPGAATTDRLGFSSCLFAYKANVCVSVCAFMVVQGVYVVQGVHMGRKLAMRGLWTDEPTDEAPPKKRHGNATQ